MSSDSTTSLRPRRFVFAPAVGLASVLLMTTASSAAAEDHWPRFRGPHGTGAVETGNPPTVWSAESGTNLAWSASIPGRGWSSPIVWGDRVFVTSAVNVAGGFKEPSTGIYGNDYAAELADEGLSDDEILERVVARDIELSTEAKEIRYLLLALDARTGDVVWEREVHRGAPFGGRHRKNTYASETPTTDGERVYVYFGNVGLFCFSMDGEALWEKKWPPRAIYLDFGTASSPVVHGERVYVQHDNQEDSFLTAVDKRSGEEVFWVGRDGGHRMQQSGWSTPFVWSHEARTEVVAVGKGRAVSYDPEDGTVLWRLSGLSGQATPTPLAGHGMLFVATGSQGESNRPVFAIRPGGSGDISLKNASGKVARDGTSDFVAWMHPRASAYTSSPLLYRGLLYIVNDNGILSVLDARSGKRLYQARVGGSGFTFSASPWAYGDHVFFLSEDGDTIVTKASSKGYEEVRVNPLGEMSFASPAIAGDALYLRTQTKLYRVTAEP